MYVYVCSVCVCVCAYCVYVWIDRLIVKSVWYDSAKNVVMYLVFIFQNQPVCFLEVHIEIALI